MDLSIRGIGRKGSSEAQDPNIGITVDGVSYGYTGLSAWEFVDVESVEVLRGPTGTTGGKNASVGGLNVTTKKPSFVPSTDVSLRLGQRDGLFGYAAVGGPVVENLLAWRGTFYVSNQQGDYANQYDAGDNTYTDRHKISGKVQALLTPTPGFTAHLSVNIQPETAQNDNGLNFFHAPIPTYANGQPTNLSTDASTRLARRWFGQLQNYSYNNNYLNYNSGLQNQDNARPLRTGTRGGFLNLTWDLPGHQLTSITSYNNLYFDARNDEGTPFDISTQGGGGVRYVQFTQELRLGRRCLVRHAAAVHQPGRRCRGPLPVGQLAELPAQDRHRRHGEQESGGLCLGQLACDGGIQPQQRHPPDA
jgi:outer membrane receptor protein involved in Fe transport